MGDITFLDITLGSLRLLTCKFCPYMPFIQNSNKGVRNREIKPPHPGELAAHACYS